MFSISLGKLFSYVIVVSEFVHPVKVTVNVKVIGWSQTNSQSTVDPLAHWNATVDPSTFALVTIDQDGPASYPDKPKTLVTKS